MRDCDFQLPCKLEKQNIHQHRHTLRILTSSQVSYFTVFLLELPHFADDMLLFFFSPLGGGSLFISFQLKESFESQAINTVIRPILVNVYNRN